MASICQARQSVEARELDQFLLYFLDMRDIRSQCIDATFHSLLIVIRHEIRLEIRVLASVVGLVFKRDRLTGQGSCDVSLKASVDKLAADLAHGVSDDI